MINLTWDEANDLMREGYTINSSRPTWGLNGSYLSMILGRIYIHTFGQDMMPFSSRQSDCHLASLRGPEMNETKYKQILEFACRFRKEAEASGKGTHGCGMLEAIRRESASDSQ